MAIIRGAFGGGQIKGSLSGNTFQQGPFGQVIRNRTVPVNPNSPGQVAVRSALAFASAGWVEVLSQAERDGWQAYAAATPIPDRFGTTQVVSGRMMFMRTNVATYNFDGTLVTSPPPLPGIPPPPGLTIISTTDDGLQIQNATPAIPAGWFVRVSVGIPVHQARNFYKAPFGRQVQLTHATTFPFTLLPIVFDDQVYFVSARQYDDTGRVSNEIIYRSPVTVTVGP